MAFDLSTVVKGAERKARKVIIYGTPKLGKSTLASSAKNALVIPTEDRVAHIACDKTPVCHTYAEVFDILTYLIDNQQKHQYRRIIIDSIDWLEPMLHEHVLKKMQGAGINAKSLTDDHCKETAFFKGLKYHAVNGWKGFLKNCDILRDAGFDIILVAHSSIVKMEPPDADAYDKNVMKIDRYSLSVLEEWADVIAFYDKKIYVNKEKGQMTGKATSAPGNARTLYMSGENPSMMSGNSFGLPDIDVDLKQTTEIMEWILTANNNVNPNETVINIDNTKKSKKGE